MLTGGYCTVKVECCRRCISAFAAEKISEEICVLANRLLSREPDAYVEQALVVVLAVALLADGEGDVAVLDHVLDLLAHYRDCQ